MREVIIHRQFTSEEEYLVNVMIIRIPGKSTNDVMKVLCDKVPLQMFELSHLKRVRKYQAADEEEKGCVEIIVCPESFYNDLVSGIVSGSSDGEEKKPVLEALQEIIKNSKMHKTVQVGRYEPEHKGEFDTWNKFWPINFHPGELERVRQKSFTDQERDLVASWQRYLLTEVEQTKELFDLKDFGAFLINPNNKEILASAQQVLAGMSTDHRQLVRRNPLVSPVMLCIEEVAQMAKGLKPGKGKNLLDIFFWGLSDFLSEKLPDGHYLCTGLDLFVFQEVDVMIGMALVHSRIRRVFYVQDNPHGGCWKSGGGHLHALRLLNHRYRVFQLDDNDQLVA
jgi:tRNA-specific adenosine deaminase 3